MLEKGSLCVQAPANNWGPDGWGSPNPFLDDEIAWWGSSSDIGLQWNTSQTRDAMIAGISGTGAFILTTTVNMESRRR
jgi:hypothetical protein